MESGTSPAPPMLAQDYAAIVELIAKVVASVLGVLYVLGLFISNIQLMSLGISNFSAFNSRNVFVGFSFVIYLIVPVLAIALIVFPSYILMDPTERRAGSKLSMPPGFEFMMRPRVLVPAVLYAGLMFWMIVGTLIGTMLVYGKSIDELLAIMFKDFLAYFEILSTQFSRAYLHIKIIIGVIVFSLWVPIFKINLDNNRNSRIALILMIVFINVPYFMLLVFDYAEETYPNMRYNIGGGQPQIAQLSLTGKISDLAGLPVDILCGVNPGGSVQALTTRSVAIWYQSDQFIYISEANKLISSQLRLVAIDLKLVRNIKYLPDDYVIFSSGSIKKYVSKETVLCSAGGA